MSILINKTKAQMHEGLWGERWWIVCLALLLFVGGVFRLSSLALIEFRHDSAYWALDAYRILTESSYFPLVGQQVGSVNIELYNGPILSYITAVIFSVSGFNPTHVAMFIAACNIAGILITFLLGRRLYSVDVGLIAATFMSLSPWLVLYGRMFWPQAFFPFLIPLGLFTLLHAVESCKLRWYLVYGVLLGIGLQLHLSVIAVAGTSLLYIIFYSHHKILSITMVGVGSLIGYGPIVLYDLLNGFVNLNGLIHLPTLHAVNEPRIYHFIKTLWNFENVLSGQALWVSKLSDVVYLPPAIDWGQGLIFSILFLLGIAAIIIENSFGKPFKQAIKFSHHDGLLLFLVVFPTAYLFFSRSLIQRHYFLFLYPVPFLIIARGFALSQAYFKRKNMPVVISLLFPLFTVVACSLNIVTIIYGYNFLDQYGGEGQYGTILTDKKSAVEFIRRHSKSSYEVDIADVQETLPYVFLFQAQDNIILNGSEDAAHSLYTATDTEKLAQYKIIESKYYPESGLEEKDILYKSRGVMVIAPVASAN